MTDTLSWPYFDDEEIEAVTAILRSGRVNYWTGEACRHFEAEFAQMVGVRHAVTLANGTVALELALLALGIGEGDEVVVTPRSFMASAAAIVARGAEPAFADVDRDSQNINADTIQAVLTPRTRAVICVHLAGWPCDMEPILALVRERGLYLIEDCAQAHGARYCGRPVGSFGHAAAFSFCQDKIMSTAGEGGMLVTDDTVAWSRAWSYKDHGKSWAAIQGRSPSPSFRWVHDTFGTNWRMTELQATVGRIQLRKLPNWLEQRRCNAAILDAALGDLPALRLTSPPPWIEHAYYKYYAFVRPECLRPSWDRDRLVTEITAAGVPCFSGSCPEIYRERAFAGTRFRPAWPLPVARELGETSLMLLVHPTIGAQIRETASIVRDIVLEATLPEALNGEAAHQAGS